MSKKADNTGEEELTPAEQEVWDLLQAVTDAGDSDRHPAESEKEWKLRKLLFSSLHMVSELKHEVKALKKQINKYRAELGLRRWD